MQLRSLIGKLQSPAFQAVAGIAQHAGGGMTVARHQSIRFPTGTCQVWEFTPALPPLDRPPVVVAVFLRKRKLELWTPVDRSYDEAVAHYTAKAQECERRALEASVQPAGPPAQPSPLKVITLPPPPQGLRVTLLAAGGQPLALGGKPVVFAGAVGGAP